MRSGSNRIDFYFYGNRKNERRNCEGRSSSIHPARNVPVLVGLVFIAVTILVSAGPVCGQFMVQPMKMEPKPRANKKIVTSIQLHSFDVNEVLDIDLKVVELDQNPDGAWHIFDSDPNSLDYEENYDVSKLSSCRAWITLGESKVKLGPAAQMPVEVTIKVPPNAQGFYGAGIIASMPVLNTNSDVGILIRYLVPVLIEIQGRTLRPQIEFQNVGGINVPPDPERG